MLRLSPPPRLWAALAPRTSTLPASATPTLFLRTRRVKPSGLCLAPLPPLPSLPRTGAISRLPLAQPPMLEWFSRLSTRTERPLLPRRSPPCRFQPALESTMFLLQSQLRLSATLPRAFLCPLDSLAQELESRVFLLRSQVRRLATAPPPLRRLLKARRSPLASPALAATRLPLEMQLRRSRTALAPLAPADSCAPTILMHAATPTDQAATPRALVCLAPLSALLPAP